MNAPAPRQVSLVVQTSFLGDMVLTTALIARLAARGPVVVVATPTSAPLLANHPAVTAVLIYDKRGSPGPAALLRIARAARTQMDRAADGAGAGSLPRVAYLAQGSLRSAALAALAGVPERVSFSSSAGKLLSTRVIPYDAKRHHAERLWQLADEAVRDATPHPPEFRPRLHPRRAEQTAVSTLLTTRGWSDAPFIVFAPGSRWATKRWPYYAELAHLLAEHMPIVVVGDDRDQELARSIESAAPGRVLDATGKLSLLATADLIARAAVLVTNDSAPLHLASATGTPTVAIFGPTVPGFGFGPLAPASIIAEHELSCRPCHAHGPEKCPLGHWQCMRELTPAAIAERTLSLLTPTQV